MRQTKSTTLAPSAPLSSRSSSARLYLIALASLMLSAYLGLRLGSTMGADWQVMSQIRLPRVLLACAVGMGLSIAGAALQSLFANPLCEPYTLGVSSGAAVGAVIGSALGLDWSVGGLAGSAFVGALTFALVLYGISLRSQVGQLGLLLTGVMLGFVGSSGVALWMALSDGNGIQGALFWLLGDLSRARLRGSVVAVWAVIGVASLVWGQSGAMDALLLGEDSARSLGIDLRSTRRRILLLSSLLVALSVSGAGIIGFVGLVVPHFVRRISGALHYRLLPLCAIWGATVVILADLATRRLASPYEIPVGVVTALVGAPLFLWILLKGKNQ